MFVQNLTAVFAPAEPPQDQSVKPSRMVMIKIEMHTITSHDSATPIMWLHLETLRDAAIVFGILVLLPYWIQHNLNPNPQPKTKRSRKPPPPPIPVQPKSDEIFFQNSTKQPYNPTIEVSERLWSILGGDNTTCFVHHPDQRPVGITAALATHYLRENSHSDYMKDVQNLKEATKDIAIKCLAKMCKENQHLFSPGTMRSLQLTSTLDEELECQVDGKNYTGILCTFYEELSSAGVLKYTLTIQPHEPVAGLPIITRLLTSEQWFAESCGIKFKRVIPKDKQVGKGLVVAG